MSKLYIVFPPAGWGSEDMVIVADNETEAADMFYKESGMAGDSYNEARIKGCKVVEVDKTKGVKYVRWENL